MKLRGSRGFTLIELLVVVAIIGILSSVVLTSLGTARSKARDAKRISDIKQMQNALELYFSTYSRYPTATEMANGTDNTPAGARYLAPKFMPNIPQDPFLSEPYKYAARRVSGSANCLAYHLGAILEDTSGASPVIQSDNDVQVGTLCTPPAGLDAGLDFKGDSSDCTAGGAAPDACFDVSS